MSSLGNPNKVLSLSQWNTASPEHGAGGSNNTTARIKITSSFFAYRFGRCYANLPTQWRRHVGACLNEPFQGAWTSLNFDKEYLFGFETLVFATLRILSMHKQLVTLQRERNTWNRIIWPPVFPTHRLYLGGPPRYINGRPSIFGDTFLFLLLLLSLTTFFYPPEIMKPSAIG